ncbi:MAG: family 10 glycosylhydrolase [Bacillota bacterium]|nr:family 10 glycosylhydrolase [Bacillota bacterium]
MGKVFKRLLPMLVTLSLFFAILAISFNTKGNNQNDTKTPNEPAIHLNVSHKGEMLAVWVPYMTLSLENGTQSEAAFKSKFDNIISVAKKSGMNTLIVQIRPFADALYPSKYFPWSHILTGTQGQDPGYDPLKIMVQDTHAAGLEFHAWVNPLRISSNGTPKTLSKNNQYYTLKKENSDYVLSYNNSYYLNPAYPEVRKLIIDDIREIVSKYSVDGIQFDDYFYPTQDSGFDQVSYQKYTSSLSDNANPLSQPNWRTNNINALISGVYSAVHIANKNAVFGISPEGNMSNDISAGADVYSWSKDSGYIDYICPQVYVNFDSSVLPYGSAVDDWRKLVTCKNVKLYIGLAVYKAGSDADSGSWKKSDNIIEKEIEFARTKKVDGFMLYSWDYLQNSQTAQEMKNVMKVLS